MEEVKSICTDGPLPEGLAEAWSVFLSEEHQPEDVFRENMLFPLQRVNEWRQMMDVARSVNPRTVMEIGADKGGSLWTWLRCLPDVDRCVACEIRGTPYAEVFESAFPNLEFCWQQRSSLEWDAVSSVAHWLRETCTEERTPKIDVLFIDGDKSRFEEDFDLWRPLVSNQGVVFMHDVTDRSPGEAFKNVIRRGYRSQTIFCTDEVAASLLRENAGILPLHAHDAWLRHWRGRSCGVGVIFMDGGKER